ncbi:hypothetical protein [Halolamina sp.]|jgi:DNA polymerase IV (DinB-like DNA polymerase)|uniref:DinB/UmuC family translesion DNA polymerase n=1 Tax=Halolamina sp. TaxID=1940283 RepID=UPI00067821A3
MYRTISVTVVRPPYDVNTRAESLTGPVDDLELVEEVVLALLESEGETVRKLGVRVSNRSFAAEEQATLGGSEWAADGDGSADGEASEFGS